MTREEAKSKLYGISITDLGSKCVGYCTYSDAEELIDKIYDDFEKKELDLLIEAGGHERGEEGWKEEAQKWKAVAERQDIIIEWLREQCLDSRLI